MTFSDALSLISCIVGIAGFLYGLSEKKKRRSIQWSDLDVAVKAMTMQMKREFVPDVLYVPTQKAGIIAELMIPYLQNYTPTFFGIGIPKQSYSYKKAYSKIHNAPDYFHFETSKWDSFVPKYLMAYKTNNLLIVDDFAMSGEYLEKLKECLIHELGFQPSKIRTLCLATTQVAVNNNTAPNYSWRISDSAIVYLPWGRPQ